MIRPPRTAQESLFNGPTVWWSLIQGGCALVMSLVVFAIGRLVTQHGDEARAMAFTTLMVANLALIATNVAWTRSLLTTLHSSNRPMWWVIGGVCLFIGVMLYATFFSKLLSFMRVSAGELLACIMAGLFSVLWFEIVKGLRRRKTVQVI